MRFQVSEELTLFAESVRAAIDDWRPPYEPELGSWQDDRDDELAARVAAAGWSDLWAGDEVLGARRRGRNRARAGSSARQSRRRGDARSTALGRRQGSTRSRRRGRWPFRCEEAGSVSARRRRRRARRSRSTAAAPCSVDVSAIGQLEDVAAASCWRAWNAATLAYFAGLAGRALELAVEHARAREQFGAPLASLPAVQSRLADAALAADAIALLAWAAASNEGGLQEPELRWAGGACCDVTAAAHQVHGAVGFALETGLHVYYRRARSVHAWTTAACAATR